uniref:Variant surface glycoprotein 1125.1121 n=1 Tax=Trypanosoma brucei TaxID=5691 RepID=A0A1J0R6A5_9TRYP|nr:variant surface glycoprotein 1125.1121 [Trypanosoma brucei]
MAIKQQFTAFFAITITAMASDLHKRDAKITTACDAAAYLDHMANSGSAAFTASMQATNTAWQLATKLAAAGNKIGSQQGAGLVLLAATVAEDAANALQNLQFKGPALIRGIRSLQALSTQQDIVGDLELTAIERKEAAAVASFISANNGDAIPLNLNIKTFRACFSADNTRQPVPGGGQAADGTNNIVMSQLKVTPHTTTLTQGPRLCYTAGTTATTEQCHDKSSGTSNMMLLQGKPLTKAAITFKRKVAEGGEYAATDGEASNAIPIKTELTQLLKDVKELEDNVAGLPYIFTADKAFTMTTTAEFRQRMATALVKEDAKYSTATIKNQVDTLAKTLYGETSNDFQRWVLDLLDNIEVSGNSIGEDKPVALNKVGPTSKVLRAAGYYSAANLIREKEHLRKNDGLNGSDQEENDCKTKSKDECKSGKCELKGGKCVEKEEVKVEGAGTQGTQNTTGNNSFVINKALFCLQFLFLG